jgi:protein arginine kinase activator
MLCESCSKKQATVHYTEIHNGEMMEMHLCEDCARKKEIEFKPHFSLADFLTGLGDFESTLPVETKKEKCPACGLTMTDFKQSGRLGCGECYSAFRENLGPLLKRIHGRINHTGKIAGPVAKGPGRNILEKLKADLQVAITREEFEEAARLRDKIKELEKKGEV